MRSNISIDVVLITGNICQEITEDLAKPVSAFNGYAAPQTEKHTNDRHIVCENLLICRYYPDLVVHMPSLFSKRECVMRSSTQHHNRPCL